MIWKTIKATAFEKIILAWQEAFNGCAFNELRLYFIFTLYVWCS